MKHPLRRQRNSANYWTYIRLDQLLDLQNPRTTCADEMPFIAFHQVSEIYFRLILHELELMLAQREIDVADWTDRLQRIAHYYFLLIRNTAALRHCIDPEEFRAFREELYPASGFQSVQYRKIEILCAPLHELAHPSRKAALRSEDRIEVLFDALYWRQAGIGAAAHHRSTSDAFDRRYRHELLRLAQSYRGRDLSCRVAALPPELRSDAALRAGLLRFDRLANLAWPKAHLQIVRWFLGQGSGELSSTGGTDWRRYLSHETRTVRFFRQLAPVS